LLAERGDWSDATVLHERAKVALIGHRDGAGSERTGLGRALLTNNTWMLRAHARALHRSGGDDTGARQEGFEMAQWALQAGAADALAQMSVRFAKGAGPLAALVRERQNLLAWRRGEMRRLDAASGRADAKAAEDARGTVAGLDSKLDAIDAQLSVEFKDYAELAKPKPLSIAATQALVTPDEALVFFLDVPRFGTLPEESLAWVITKETARWMSIPLGTLALSDRVTALRCGLDASSWDTARERCEQLLGVEASSSQLPPFDPASAYELYQALLAPFADLTSGKHLIIVTSGPLTSLPFQVLVTEKPDASLTGMARYQKAAWLALQQPVTVLPSVGSLQALRKLPPSLAREPYIAFGNPLLDGPNGTDKRAWDKQRCPQDLETLRQRVAVAAKRIPGLGVLVRGGSADPKELRAQEPLPETADELCAVAKALGALGSETDTMWLGARATERNLKALSRQGKLARYKVLHFATHGLLSGESEAILKAKAEPALVLTPPKDDATQAGLAEDDGLLTASEVAQLELDADWVVLSACNTAAGEKGDAEALSGLARAFFYAKARALLVSHWYVSSDAAVKLTTQAFAELKANPKIGRAEALRRSMAQLITKGNPEEAHPATWAPFVLVGEGGR
jgi:CHAT domain-containing protein